jgi:glutaconyl-CoA/methylmalonyl-CoA decarboxylase subunit delta
MGTAMYKVISQAMVLGGASLSEYINLDTLFGAVVVLAIIIVLMLITYFVNIKPNLSSAPARAVEKSPVDNAIAQIVSNEEDELISDSELVAVITAAIYASMGEAVPAGGLVVRSIRKSNASKWKNA